MSTGNLMTIGYYSVDTYGVDRDKIIFAKPDKKRNYFNKKKLREIHLWK